jgi:predicted neutral ceramidase superfamily lipid hydrolase
MPSCTIQCNPHVHWKTPRRSLGNHGHMCIAMCCGCITLNKFKKQKTLRICQYMQYIYIIIIIIWLYFVYHPLSKWDARPSIDHEWLMDMAFMLEFYLVLVVFCSSPCQWMSICFSHTSKKHRKSLAVHAPTTASVYAVWICFRNKFHMFPFMVRNTFRIIPLSK